MNPETAALKGLENALQTYLLSPGPHKLELGAGSNGKPGWLATDLRENAKNDGSPTIILDVTKQFEIPSDSFDYIYCEHMIEHITLKQGQHMLNECYRILKPGGIIRLVTPSIGFLMRIMSPDRSKFEQSYFEWSIKKFVPDAPTLTNALFLNNFVRAWGHTFIYDHETLRFIMNKAGFSNIEECQFGHSSHFPLMNLENEKRLPPGYLELESMIFEGSKI
ncbi:MAG: class I SAM-dependent methyltransferase [Erythrobacter sp.]